MNFISFENSLELQCKKWKLKIKLLLGKTVKFSSFCEQERKIGSLFISFLYRLSANFYIAGGGIYLHIFWKFPSFARIFLIDTSIWNTNAHHSQVNVQQTDSTISCYVHIQHKLVLIFNGKISIRSSCAAPIFIIEKWKLISIRYKYKKCKPNQLIAKRWERWLSSTHVLDHIHPIINKVFAQFINQLLSLGFSLDQTCGAMMN